MTVFGSRFIVNKVTGLFLNSLLARSVILSQPKDKIRAGSFPHPTDRASSRWRKLNSAAEDYSDQASSCRITWFRTSIHIQ